MSILTRSILSWIWTCNLWHTKLMGYALSSPAWIQIWNSCNWLSDQTHFTRKCGRKLGGDGACGWCQPGGGGLAVVYFEQPTGAPHTVRWSKSIFDAKTNFWVLLSHKMYFKNAKNNKKHVLKGGLPAFRCYS